MLLNHTFQYFAWVYYNVIPSESGILCLCQQFTMAITTNIFVSDFLLSIFLITYLGGILEINERRYFKLPVIVQK